MYKLKTASNARKIWGRQRPRTRAVAATTAIDPQ
jgi:hypothetical protein